MLNRYLGLSTFVNQGLKLSLSPRVTCIRKYTLTYDEEEREKKRKVREILVNVIMPDQKVSCMTIEAAQKMAKRRDLTLTKLTNPPKFASFAGHDVYELFTKSQQIKELAEPVEVASETGFKEKKTLSFSATIAIHDVSVKVKQIKKWLSKKHIVVVIIADDGMGDAVKEKSTYVQTECQDVCQINRVTKKHQAVLTLVPNQTNKPQDRDNSQQKPKDNDHKAPAQDGV